MDEAAIANLGIGRKFQPTVFDADGARRTSNSALKAPRGPVAGLRWRHLAGQGPHPHRGSHQ